VPRDRGYSFLDGFLMRKLLKHLLVSEDGPTAVEYAVMLALIVALCLSSIGLLSAETGNSFNNSAAELNSVLGS
jgi:pilus assembly protein Flp/PilA